MTDLKPDYGSVVRFLIEPLLEDSSGLKIDCEMSSNSARVWVRVAFAGEERGRVFGRGGRNIQAIRTVLQATAAVAGQTAHLDVYGGAPADGDGSKPHRDPRRSHGGPPQRKPRPSRARQQDD